MYYMYVLLYIYESAPEKDIFFFFLTIYTTDKADNGNISF